MRLIKILTLLIFCSINLHAQTHNFSNTDNGWSSATDNGVLTIGTTFLTASWNAGATNPKISNAQAGFDGSVNKYITLKIKNSSSSGPETMRFIFPKEGDGFKYYNISITKSDTEFKSYYIDLSNDADWNGIENTIELQFKAIDNTDYAAEGDFNIDIDMISASSVNPILLNEIFISTNGDDNNSGNSTENAVKSFSKAITLAAPGATIYFLDGTFSNDEYLGLLYDQTTYAKDIENIAPEVRDHWFLSQNSTTILIEDIHGTEDNYYTIKPYNEGSVTLKNDGLAAILVKNSSYIKIEGFNIVGELDNIPLETALHQQFLYKDLNTNEFKYRIPPNTPTSEVEGMTLDVLENIDRPTLFNTAGITVNKSHHIEISNNTVSNMPGEGIRSFESDFLHIKNNTVFKNSLRSSTGVHGLSLYLLNSSVDPDNINFEGYRTIIENNEVYSNDNEVYSWNHTKPFVTPHIDEGKGITIQRCDVERGWEKGRVLIRNNLSYSNGLSGIHINVGDRIDIVNNTVYNNYISTEKFSEGSQHGISTQGSNDIQIINNIVVSEKFIDEGGRVLKLSDACTNITINKNLLVGTLDDNSTQINTNSVNEVPNFQDASTNNFQLLPTSAAIDNGDQNWKSIIERDFNNNLRSDSSIDIGAFEYFKTGNRWIFNNQSFNGWNTLRIDHKMNEDNIELITNGQSNPKFQHSSASVNANLNKYLVLNLKVDQGGPTLLKLNFPNGSESLPLKTDNTFHEYTLKINDADWNGTINSIELAFKTDDETEGGADYQSNLVSLFIKEISFVESISSDLTEIYVDPDSGDNNFSGSYDQPIKSISAAIDRAANNNIDKVYVKSGSYTLNSSIEINTVAATPIVLSPEPNGTVTLTLKSFRNFRFFDGAKNIEVKGFKINGASNNVDHWALLSQYVWQPNTLTNEISGGGICFQIENAEDIKISNNVIHDFYQKAVNIEDGRYIAVSGNIIYNIGQTSLSGGHGIMRQQGSGSFTDSDDPTKYRWDIDGNMIFNVHQRIYSWVPSKGYLNMTLDEGKPILIDETPDHDTSMRARIRNNVVAFSKIDAIRLKPTNGLEVLNNSIFTKDIHADGITNTVNGFNANVYGDPFLNFNCSNNAVEVISTKDSYHLDDALNSAGSSFANNYAAYGSVVPSTLAIFQNTDMFVDPNNGNFNLINTNLTNVGVESSVLTALNNLASNSNVTIANDNWEHDHLKMTQTMLDNVPGVEDGITNNEPVFTDSGTYDASDLEFDRGRKAYYFTINQDWQTQNISSNSVLNRGNGLDAYDGMYEIVVPETYSDWYDVIKATYLQDTNNDGTADTAYQRIRYGASIIAQNKIFQTNSLHVVELDSTTEFTSTLAHGFDLTIDGDVLLNFNYIPNGNETFDLIIADNINGAFNNVIVEGFSGEYYFEVVTENATQVLRLTLGASAPEGNVYFVDTVNGTDQTDFGLSPESPFKTIDYAVSFLTAGDTLNIMPGTYYNPTYGDGNYFKSQSDCTLFVNGLNGTSSQPIIIKAHTPNSVILKGDGLATVLIKNSSYIKLEGIETYGETESIPLSLALEEQFLYRDLDGNLQYRVPPNSTPEYVEQQVLPVLDSSIDRPTYFNTHGIIVNNSNNIDVVNNLVHHMPGEGIRAVSSDYINIIGNEVHNCSRRSSTGVHGISLYTMQSIDENDAVKVVMAKNLVHHNYNEVYSWNETKTFINPHFDEGKGITVMRSTFARGWEHGKIRIENNIAYLNGFAGVQINEGERIEIFNNSLYFNSLTGEGSQHGITAQNLSNDIKVYNNIVVIDQTLVGGRAVKVSDNSANIMIGDNIIIGTLDANSDAIDTNTIFEDPLYMDPINFDFSISENSPAVNSANVQFSPAEDFYSNTRDTTPDIGAIEFNASLSSNQHDAKSFKIFPNPASSYIRVEIQFKKAKVYDIYGRKVLESSDKIIDVTQLKTGVYLLSLYDDSNNVLGTSKVIKK